MLDFKKIRDREVYHAVKITKENIDDIATYINGAVWGGEVVIFDEYSDSNERVPVGDWIIKTGYKEYESCKDEYFNDSYEEVE